MEEFLKQHEMQLYSMDFPRDLCGMLYQKLEADTLDAGTFFRIQQHINEKNEFTSQEAISLFDLHANSNVFLIDHAWTTRISSIRDTLSNNYKLLNRIKSLIRIRGDKILLSEAEDPPKLFEDYCMDFDEQGLNEVPVVLEGTQGLSLWGNNFESISQIERVLPGLKALWLNENPISKDPISLFTYFEDFFPEIEILNSKFTKTANTWALQYASNQLDLESVTEIDLSDRDITRASPSILQQLPNLTVIDISGNKLSEIWEQAVFQLPNLRKLKVDHASEDWAWRNLKHFRCLKYINENDTAKGKPHLIDFVISKLWGYLNTYRLSTEETYDENSVWYLLDEFGSSILHSDVPNCKLMPFLYTRANSEAITYSLLWPIRPIRTGEILYRDYLPNITEAEFRSYRLYPWVVIPQVEALDAVGKWKENRFKGRVAADCVGEGLGVRGIHEGKLRVATDLEFFARSLSDERFELSEVENADVVWTRGKIFDLDMFDTDKYLNQFPYETCIVMKNLLAQTVQKNAEVDWLPITFDLNHELPALMGEYFTRQNSGRDNHWIIKPANLSRGIDCHVTNSLDCIIRMMETGPKIAQKYIEKPFLLNKKKFDLRFIVLLRSATPLVLYVYNHFWIRSANQDYNLSHSQNYSYETHFTVNNYSNAPMQHIHDDEFIRVFEEATGTLWETTQSKIYKSIKELFTVATRTSSMQRDKSRAIYGVDVLLSENLEPFILEVNFCPDCERAVNYYPQFTNQVFNCLFYEEIDGVSLL